MDLNSNLEYQLVPPERFDDVIQHLRYNFFAHEPLNYAVQLCELGQPHVESEKYALTTLKDGLSLMIIDKETNQVAGVALNGILRRGDLQISRQNLLESDDEKFKRIFTFLLNLNESADIFNTFHVDQVFECRILSVDSNYRRRGLADQLLHRSEKLAVDNGFKILKVDATGCFSQRISERMGLTTIAEATYADQKDASGNRLFDVPAPHTCLKIMIKHLSNEEE